MKRYFFVSDDLDDLEATERELESKGIDTTQIHVLSLHDAEVEKHRLHEVHAFLRKDVIHSAEIGALIGLVLSTLVIIVAYFSGLPETIGWVPFVFLAIILLGFFTWEGGFFGIQTPNSRFRKFMSAMREGKHVFLVDVDPEQESIVNEVAGRHASLSPAGVGTSSPRWVIRWQQRARAFVNWAP